jgi:hypothetical protein
MLYQRRFRSLRPEHAMADHSSFDMTPHIETWNGFLKFMTYGAVGVIVLLSLMAIFLL